jgi:alkaline phosphatase D
MLLVCSFLFISTAMTFWEEEGPYFGNGIKHGWADHNSITVWSRLTRHREMVTSKMEFRNVPSAELAKLIDADVILSEQLPHNVQLHEMHGASPGSSGQVRLTFWKGEDEKQEMGWVTVGEDSDFTFRTRLTDLTPGATYHVELHGRRAEGNESITDNVRGTFTLPSLGNSSGDDVEFCVVTCHDFNRMESSDGHAIYPAMRALAPDFLIHTGDKEYMDQPRPYAMTKELMRFKWNRISSLRNQREFFATVPAYFLRDDHDLGGDNNHPRVSYGLVSQHEAVGIHDEYFPMDVKSYKTVRWGKHLQVWLLEVRQFRSANDIPDGHGKTILGQQQREWLLETFTASDATFRVLISPIPILGPEKRTTKNDNWSNNGFMTEGREIRALVNNSRNAFYVNGDRHWQYVSRVDNVWEFGCGPGTDRHVSFHTNTASYEYVNFVGGFLHVRVTGKTTKPSIEFSHHLVDGSVANRVAFLAH